ncbi:hypothetical protein OCE55_04920 [Bacillus paranthracis]|uniref:Uncharacterized protein n=2 Tax=root TaxID=1 RepID=A0A2H4JC83_9CAUD|nr:MULTISPECIES: hypothetical protein [Bacillus cereus group]ASN69641.1 hypothetical protein 9AX2_55 [uncultured Caudovirales phage]ONG71174.1 hypothetical protein BKK44_12410 [Bacillus cereus]MCU5387377.1 hypothetical protein [Bacillus paranthracis]MDA1824616.1 hypothetical protein [Bacillus cereus group sp. BY25LC]MDA2192023.1 hypothetical protein [Bacillus cereus group sp. Bc238]
MYNCMNQETLITIIPTSRHGKAYDIAKVEATFQLNEPITETDSLLVPPQMELIPQDIFEILKLSHVNLAPMTETYINEALSDFATESSDPNRDQETKEDAMLGLVRKYLTKVVPEQIGSDYFYRVSYEYAVYPNENGSYFLYATVPFKGFNMPATSQIRFISILPTGSTVVNTTGVDINQQSLPADQDDVANGKPVVSYFWQNDPEFMVEYRY